jgi:hypothetical protein
MDFTDLFVQCDNNPVGSICAIAGPLQTGSQIKIIKEISLIFACDNSETGNFCYDCQPKANSVINCRLTEYNS